MVWFLFIAQPSKNILFRPWFCFTNEVSYNPPNLFDSLDLFFFVILQLFLYMNVTQDDLQVKGWSEQAIIDKTNHWLTEYLFDWNKN